ncbi:AraC family transcriptional regulator, partial [Nonomuraea sp. NPDC005983]|uniref:helix-turn-helix transcriptional regulator n=1 Tax=Nonomuraea sp. NPDC005983 TaxID=3155595 RepID=UPI0033AA1FC6
AAAAGRAATRRVTPPEPTTGAARVAHLARQLLRERHLEDVTSAELAEAAGVSRFGVYRAFHAAYGLSPSDYQRQLRLGSARRLIASGLPLGEVAARTGFADQSHLTRWFNRYFGLTPGAYRDAVGPGVTPS